MVFECNLGKRILLFVLFLFIQSPVFSQNATPVPVLTSPYNVLLVHLQYLQPDDYQPQLAAKVFRIPDSLQAQELAIQLKQIYDGKGLYVYMNQLPQDANYKDSLTQRSYYTPFPLQLPTIYLEKTDSFWHYSAQTVERIPVIHRELYPFGTDFLVSLFPQSTYQKWLGLALWQWIGLVFLFLAALLVQWLLSRILRPLIRLIAQSKYSSPVEDKNMLWKVARLASFVVLMWLLKGIMPLMQLPVKVNAFFISGLEITAVVIAVLLGLGIIDLVMMYAHRYAKSTVRKLDEQLIPILRRILKIIIVIIGLIYILRLLDVNVTALIAGVSIGGLALALAAQDTVKNLIGSVMIFFDKPFQIGDWIVAGGNEGEVIEVGIRSTRLQSVDSSIISVPNNEIASTSVKNLGVRQYRLMKLTLGVTYDTPPVLIEQFLAGLRELIEAHPKTKKDNYIVYLNNFGSSALEIYFRTHLIIESFAEEMESKEELSFGILRLAEVLGVRFAFPSQTLFIEEMPQRGSTAPDYETDPEKLAERRASFFKRNKK